MLFDFKISVIGEPEMEENFGQKIALSFPLTFYYIIPFNSTSPLLYLSIID